jgi:hypothetical protein
MPEGQGKFLIATEAPPAMRQNKRGRLEMCVSSAIIEGMATFVPIPGIMPPVRRKVFISYFRGDKTEVEGFVMRWGYLQNVFIPRIVGACGNEAINSQNAEYVIGKIRREQIADSTVTLLMLGSCTHSRRHVDWEIKASLRQGEDSKPNGLIGILLPSQGGQAHLPDRFQQNWNSLGNCYASYHCAPSSASELAWWIEDAYFGRESRAHMIKNSAEMMGYNSRCRVCNVTHSLRPSGLSRLLADL